MKCKIPIFFLFLGSGLGNFDLMIPYSLTILGVVLILFNLFISKKITRINNQVFIFLILILILIFWVVLSVFFNVHEKSLLTLAQYILSFLIFFLTLFYVHRFGINSYSKVIAYSFILISLLSYLFYMLKLFQIDVDHYMPFYNGFKAEHAYLRNYGLSVEPSIFAFYSLSFGMLSLLVTKSIRLKFLISILIIISVITSQSDSALILSLLVPLFFVKKNVWFYLFFFIVVIILSYYVPLFIDYLELSHAIRLEAILKAFNEFNNYNIFVGKGVSYVTSSMTTFNNLLITVLVEIGIIGFLLFLLIFFLSYWSVVYSKRYYSPFNYNASILIIFYGIAPFLFTSVIFHPFLWASVGAVVGNSINLRCKNIGKINPHLKYINNLIL